MTNCTIVLHNYEGINELNVTFPAVEGGLPTRRAYRCHTELVNWSTRLRERKIELNEIRTQQNDIRRLETKERGDLLKQDNVMTKLLGEKNFLFWMDGLKRLSELVPKGTSNYKIATLVRGSIENAEDKRNTQGMTVTEDIVAYVNQRYMNSPNLLNATLSDIREKKVPRNHQQAADNIASTITMG